MIKNHNTEGAIFIATTIAHAAEILDATPTMTTVEFAVDNFLRECDPRINYNRDTLLELVGIIAIP